jgi:hypothetical protein
MREIKAGSSYLGESDLRVHFGIGRATDISRIEIRWPSGATELIQNTPANGILTISEGKGITSRTPFVRK